MGQFGQHTWGTHVWGGAGGSPTPPPPTTGIPGSPGTTPGEFNNPTPTTNTGATNNVVPPGSTSSVAGFIPDILMIIQEACEQAGVDFNSGYTIRTAKRSIDLLGMEWANEGLNLWTLDQQTTTIVAGQAGYALPADTVDLLVPSLRTVDTNGHTRDILLARQDFSQFAAIVDKGLVARPTTVYIHRQATNPYLWLWPVPDSHTPYTLLWWRMRRMQNTGYSTNLVDTPFRFIPALISGLAWQMALKKAGPKDWNLITQLERIYRGKFTQAQREDRDRSPIYLSPASFY